MSINTRAEFVCFNQIVSTDCSQAAVADLHLTMKLYETFRLSMVFRTKTATTQNQDHRVRPLQARKFTALAGMVGQLVIRKYRTGNHVSTHESSPRSI